MHWISSLGPLYLLILFLLSSILQFFVCEIALHKNLHHKKPCLDAARVTLSWSIFLSNIKGKYITKYHLKMKWNTYKTSCFSNIRLIHLNYIKHYDIDFGSLGLIVCSLWYSMKELTYIYVENTDEKKIVKKMVTR